MIGAESEVRLQYFRFFFLAVVLNIFAHQPLLSGQSVAYLSSVP